MILHQPEQRRRLRAPGLVDAEGRRRRLSTFLMAPDGTWQLAPAYDLTHAAGVGGYHAMSVAGESRTPGRDDLLRLAEHGGVARRDAVRMLDRIRSALDDWTSLAARFGIARERERDIAQVLKRQSVLLGLSRGQAT